MNRTQYNCTINPVWSRSGIADRPLQVGLSTAMVIAALSTGAGVSAQEMIDMLPPPPSMPAAGWESNSPLLPSTVPMSPATTPMPIDPMFQSAPVQTFTAPPASISGYMVVVPGDRYKLSHLAQKMLQLGFRQDNIQQRENPYGPHLAVGPFANYNEASQVNRQLRGNGMDSRVYFKR